MAKRRKRSHLEIRYDEKGLPSILETYERLREFRTENEAEREACGAGTDVTRQVWRRRARAGEEPFLTIFRAIDDVEQQRAETEIPALFREVRERDPVKAYALQFPRAKYAREEEARSISLAESHAQVLREFVEGLSTHLQENLTRDMYHEVADRIYDYVETFEADTVDARVSDAFETKTTDANES